MALAAYRPIIQTPGVKMLFAAGTVARLPVGFETLGIVLVVRAVTGSFAMAGAAAAAMFAVAALTAAPLGRLVDRFGQMRVLVPTSLWNGSALAALGVAGQVEARGGVLIALAALTGVMPPISSCQRAILAGLFSGPKLQSAYAVESIVQEAVFTGGPVIATIAAAAASPPAALFTAAALTIGGTAWFTQTHLSRSWRGTHVEHRGSGAIGAPAVLVLCVFATLSAVSFGAFEVAATAFAREQGSPNAAGILLATWAIGSAIGGLLYGGRRWRRAPHAQIKLVAMASAVAFVPAALAPNLWAIIPFMAVAGLAIAPVLSLLYTLTGELAPEGMVTEAFAWLNVAFPIGFGVGAAVSGVLADGAGARVAIALAGIGAALGALVLTRWRRTLAPRQAGRSLVDVPSTSSDVR